MLYPTPGFGLITQPQITDVDDSDMDEARGAPAPPEPPGCCQRTIDYLCTTVEWICDFVSNVLYYTIGAILGIALAIIGGVAGAIAYLFCGMNIFNNEVGSETTNDTPNETLDPPRPNHEREEPLARGIAKGPNQLKVAFEIDWNNNNDPRFDDTYLRTISQNPSDPIWSLGTTRPQPERQEQRVSAALRIAEVQIRTNAENVRRNFQNLANNTHPSLSGEKLVRVKKMVCAILHRLEEIHRANDAEYRRLVPATFSQLANDAFAHCTNNLMPTLDDILTGLMGAAVGGALQKKVETALQSIRMECFAMAVRNVINRVRLGGPHDRDYYLSHEAASRNYYLRTMYRRLGLKQPVIDTHYVSFALIGHQNAVFEEFERLYSITRILNGIDSIINHPLDGSISRGQFTEWARNTNRVVVNALGNVVISGTDIPMERIVREGGVERREFDKRLILEYLIEIGALRR